MRKLFNNGFIPFNLTLMRGWRDPTMVMRREEVVTEALYLDPSLTAAAVRSGELSVTRTTRLKS